MELPLPRMITFFVALFCSEHSPRSFDSLDPIVWPTSILPDLIFKDLSQDRRKTSCNFTDLNKVLRCTESRILAYRVDDFENVSRHGRF